MRTRCARSHGTPMSLLDTHIGFVEALRSAGLSVSLAEGLDAISALEKVQLARPRDRARRLRRHPGEATAAARHVRRRLRHLLPAAHRQRRGRRRPRAGRGPAGHRPGPRALPGGAGRRPGRRGPAGVAGPCSRGGRALRCDAGPRAGPVELVGLHLAPAGVARRADGPARAGAARPRASTTSRPSARPGAGSGTSPGWSRATPVGASPRRRDPSTSPTSPSGPTIDRLDFTAARRSDLEEMRREIYPLARRLAARLTKEQHARRRGPLDLRRTVRASIATGGVPLTTHHRPKRPHRTDLVVLCDVSGSVANFAQFTLLLVFALREAVQRRARVHLRRRRRRGERPLPAGGRRGRGDGVAGRAASRTPRCGGAPTTAGR